MIIGLLRTLEKRTIHHGETFSQGLLAKILTGKLEGKMGGAITTAFVFLLLLLMFGALGFIFGNFN
jgi:hypothetical protein